MQRLHSSAAAGNSETTLSHQVGESSESKDSADVLMHSNYQTSKPTTRSTGTVFPGVRTPDALRIVVYRESWRVVLLFSPLPWPFCRFYSNRRSSLSTAHI